MVCPPVTCTRRIGAACDTDSDDETFETPNDVGGDPQDDAPEGTVDSRDEGTPDGE